MSENLADLEAAKGNANGTEYIKGLLEALTLIGLLLAGLASKGLWDLPPAA